MKAQVLHKYDPEMKEKVWVTEQEMPEPKLEKSSDVIVKIGAAGFVGPIYILSKVFGNIFKTLKEICCLWLWAMKMQAGLKK